MTAVTSSRDSLERFLVTGHIDTIGLVNNLISDSDFRQQVEVQYKELMGK
jgi:hypothetical protein